MIVKLANGTIDALRSQPFVLALVVINVMFLIAGLWALQKIASAVQSSDATLLEVIKGCSK